MLPAANIIRAETDVERRLHDQFGTSRADWIAVAHAAVLARNDATLFDPSNAAGQLAYIYGTRAVRGLLVPKGYEVSRQDNVEATYSRDRQLKVIYQNVDWASDTTRSPKAISGKGPASGRIIEQSAGFLFPEMEAEAQAALHERLTLEASQTWYFAVSADGDDVRAELSRPYPIVDAQFNGFAERIFILEPGDWSEFASLDFDDGDSGQHFEINVTRK